MDLERPSHNVKMTDSHTRMRMTPFVFNACLSEYRGRDLHPARFYINEYLQVSYHYGQLILMAASHRHSAILTCKEQASRGGNTSFRLGKMRE